MKNELVMAKEKLLENEFGTEFGSFGLSEDGLRSLVQNVSEIAVLHELAKRYGDLMLLKFGSRNVLIASSPDMAREFLKTNDAVWASRPELAAGLCQANEGVA
ncbi:hypothetical protein K7X08_002634 [Anisodus acutangulus]|uniref:Uncharacterized protein n=1 Tax=Anisodus acutangulus TaxID=402998 RepID=A0A9Q1R5M8_9SOLA|nr:hypothetical protein K7X08_002634 [Anisodus acutangulus]